jgi:hypothetical protein
MPNESDDHDDAQAADDRPKDGEPAESRSDSHSNEGRTRAGGVNWSSRYSADLSSLLPDFTEAIRRAMPNLNEVIRFNLPPELFPKIDVFDRIYPAIDLSDLLPKYDFAGLMPRYNFAEIAASIQATWAKELGAMVNFSAFIPKIVVPELGDAFRGILELLREHMPPNWPEGVDFDTVTTVIQNDGIPLVWVPRAAIVEELLSAPDRDTRVKILLTHSDDVMQDCRDVLAVIDHKDLTNQLPLVERVVDAFERGHVEAAQALAVVVTETVVSRTFGKDHKKIRDFVQFDPEELPLGQIRFKTALAPIGPFYTAWWPSSGDPAPTHSQPARHRSPGRPRPLHAGKLYRRGHARHLGAACDPGLLGVLTEPNPRAPTSQGRCHQPATALASQDPRSSRASAQLNMDEAALEPCRFVSSRGHVSELQTRSAIGQSLIVKASFAFE